MLSKYSNFFVYNHCNVCSMVSHSVRRFFLLIEVPSNFKVILYIQYACVVLIGP